MDKQCSFLLISLLISRFLWSTLADQQFISNICKQTGAEEDCKSVLLSDPRSLQATTVDALSLIAFDLAIDAAMAANRQANDLTRQYRGTPQSSPIAQCSDIYLDLTSELQAGKSLAESSSYRKANDAAVDALTKPDACENEFVSRNMSSLLQLEDQDLSKKCEVCASMTQLMIG